MQNNCITVGQPQQYFAVNQERISPQPTYINFQLNTLLIQTLLIQHPWDYIGAGLSDILDHHAVPALT